MRALVSALHWDGMKADFAVAGKDLREVDEMVAVTVAARDGKKGQQWAVE